MVNGPGESRTQPATASLKLAPRADAAGIARRFVHDNRDHLDPDIVANAELLVSEIVTNALRYGAGEIALTVRVDPPGIGVAVTDTGHGMPVVRAELPADDEGSGRGLFIVDAIASQWGVDPSWPPPGKTVWFDVRPHP